MSLCGGLGPSKPADSSIQTLCDEVKAEAEEKAGKPFSRFVAISYCSQVVAGTNHFIKVQVADDSHVHLRVFKPLPHHKSKNSLAAIQLDKTEEEHITYFD